MTETIYKLFFVDTESYRTISDWPFFPGDVNDEVIINGNKYFYVKTQFKLEDDLLQVIFWMEPGE